MVKVIFTDGSEMNFHGENLINAGTAILIYQNDEYKPVIIPARNVKVCGVWDKEKGEFA